MQMDQQLISKFKEFDTTKPIDMDDMNEQYIENPEFYCSLIKLLDLEIHMEVIAKAIEN